MKVIEELEKLTAKKQQGLITEEEYRSERAKLLKSTYEDLKSEIIKNERRVPLSACEEEQSCHRTSKCTTACQSKSFGFLGNSAVILVALTIISMALASIDARQRNNVSGEANRHPLLAVAPSSTNRETLCKPEEKIVFSCTIGRKIASVCASSELLPNKGYMQYRFGVPDKIERTVPEQYAHPLQTAEAGARNSENGDIAGYIKFRSGDYSYIPYWSETKATPDKTAISAWQMSDGVVIEHKNKKISVLQCDNSSNHVSADYLFEQVKFPRNDNMEGFNLPKTH